MRRKTIRPLITVFLCTLVVILSACTLPVAADKNISSEQTAVSVLFTQNAGTPSLTPTLPISPTPSPTLTVTPPILPTFLTLTPGPRPPYYTLQPGEYPWCIARRFDVDPRELLALNNLPSGMIYSPGLVLTIPQSGRPFPPPRALLPHPTTYVVPESNMSVYRIACKFGDVDPLAIVQVNLLTSYILQFGMTIQIP